MQGMSLLLGNWTILNTGQVADSLRLSRISFLVCKIGPEACKAYVRYLEGKESTGKATAWDLDLRLRPSWTLTGDSYLATSSFGKHRCYHHVRHRTLHSSEADYPLVSSCDRCLSTSMVDRSNGLVLEAVAMRHVSWPIDIEVERSNQERTAFTVCPYIYSSIVSV